MQENGVKFAVFRIEQLEGNHAIYNEMDSAINIDVHMIKVENYVDSDQYRVVLCPLLEGDMKSFEEKNSMLKLRIKDGYAKGMLGAPWKVFEQYELFIFPINFKLTNNFYRKVKSFFVPTSSLEEVKNDPVYKAKDENSENIVKPYEKIIEKDDRMFKPVLESSPESLKGKKLELLDSKNKTPPPAKKEEKKEKSPELSPSEKAKENNKKIALPALFLYFRLNEINVNLTFSSGTDILVIL